MNLVPLHFLIHIACYTDIIDSKCFTKFDLQVAMLFGLVTNDEYATVEFNSKDGLLG